ncbi:uncharacterized protein LOC115924065 [Strongylocentrotus purpuratus]|uniref:Uncharacterized protein n=1 Tax=Strongylocentrotus purpuratus TaxID=7668 RepID=A0A7M7NTW5_STRPU|nr:uncharacterized protein LOC115924065 [Strongylocentrotus purpuratus]
MAESKAKKKFLQSFKDDYTSRFPCISSSNKGKHYAFCRVCRCDLKIAHGGAGDISIHLRSKKHIEKEVAEEKAKNIPKEGRINTFFRKEDYSVINAEVMFTDFLVEHNIPLAAADHSGQLFRRMFPDSRIAKQYNCARTKASHVVQSLAAADRDTLVSQMKNSRFSLATDASTDMEAIKLYPLVIKTFDEMEGKVLCQLLSLKESSERSTGENIFGILDHELKTHNISWTNCVSLSSDNASVMLGKHKGVAAYAKEQNANIFIAGCSCHLIHLAAQKGSQKLKFPLDDLLVDVFYYIDKSSLRHQAIIRLQKEHGVATKKILKHVSTRWLSLGKVLDRLLENWSPLLEFFKDEATPNESRKRKASAAANGKQAKKVKMTNTKPVSAESMCMARKQPALASTSKSTAASTSTSKRTAASTSTSKSTAASTSTSKRTAASTSTSKSTAASTSTSKSTAASTSTSKRTAASTSTSKSTAASTSTSKSTAASTSTSKSTAASTSTSKSTAASTSTSKSTAASTSTSKSTAASTSTSKSTAASTSTCTSKSTAASTSTSKSTAASTSTSKRTAASTSTSKSTAASTSTSKRTAASTSTSKSTAASTSTSKSTAASTSTSKRTAASTSTSKSTAASTSTSKSTAASTSTSKSTAASTSTSKSTAASTSTSKSTAASTSTSKSTAASRSTCTSKSTAASTSTSKSTAASTSTSKSTAASTSTSKSTAASTSTSKSTAASTSTSKSTAASTSTSKSTAASTSTSKSTAASTSTSKSTAASTSTSKSTAASTSTSKSTAASTSTSKSTAASTSTSKRTTTQFDITQYLFRQQELAEKHSKSKTSTNVSSDTSVKTSSQNDSLQGKAARIFQQLNDPNCKLQALFLQACLPAFDGANTMYNLDVADCISGALMVLQSDEPYIHRIHRILLDQLASLLSKFVKPSAIVAAEDITKLDLANEDNHKDNEDIHIGFECRQFLKDNEDKLDVATFYTSAKNFLSASSSYMIQKYAFNDDLLLNAEVLDISARLHKKFSSVEYFIKRFNLLPLDKMDKVESEFLSYQIDKDIVNIDIEDGRIDEKWHKIGQLRDFSTNCPKYALLTSVMKCILVVFHSNSDCERIFSIVEKNKTKQRASLGTPTLGALLIHKLAVQSRGKKCFSSEYSPETLKAAKSATYQALSGQSTPL